MTEAARPWTDAELVLLKARQYKNESTGRDDKWLATVAALQAEMERLNQWVADLQSGLYVNCVYCGHRYGPGETTPVTMADALKTHVEQCPKHPMSTLKTENAALRLDSTHWKESFERYGRHGDRCPKLLYEVRDGGMRRGPCECGFDAATRPASPPEAAR